MSPAKKNVKSNPPNNLYTALLAFGFASVVATAIYTAVTCYMQYGTIFTVQ